jgi:poly-gamma-glutamate capsule biosynthesis protein CapA/YwtB (metallophosphatase superfamily)
MTDLIADEARRARAQRQAQIRREQRMRAVRTGAVAGLVLVAALAAFLGWRVMTAPANVLAVREPDSSGAIKVAAALPVSKVASAALEAARADTITVVAVGDLLFDIAPRRLIAAQGGAAPLKKVASQLSKADLTIANLEGPLSNRGKKVAGKPDHLIFEGDPRATESLKVAGIDVVDLANNHTMDYGTVALNDTLSNLEKAGVKYAGAGQNVKEAWAPAILDVKGRKIAFLAATQVLPAHFLAGANTPGVANGDQISKMVAAIKAAKKKADYVIVSEHWGTEQSYTANSAQVSQAKRFVDAGADMVLSHHPHVLQGIEFYKGKLIAYSLGNFLFPYKTTEGRKSIILRADLGRNGVSNVTATPVYLGDWGRPTVQTGAMAKSILGKLKSISARFGTKVTLDGNTARISE